MGGLQYSSRYALSLFFTPAARPAFATEIDWVARYVSKEEDDALVYLGYDSAKRRGAEAVEAEPVSMIVHTSVPYGLRKLKERADDREVIADLTTRVKALLPWLPEPTEAVLRTWAISQVRYPLALPDGAACFPLGPNRSEQSDGEATAVPALVLAGDAFSPLGSRFDGCIQSGEGAAKALLAALSVR